MDSVQADIPVGVRVLAVLLFLFGVFAFFGSLFMWGEGWLFSFPAGVDYAFPVTDILVNAPASIIAALGLWQMKRYGYIASQFTAGFYVYASVEIFVQVIQEGPPYRLEIFAPQVAAMAVGVVLVLYLWRIRSLFR